MINLHYASYYTESWMLSVDFKISDVGYVVNANYQRIVLHEVHHG